MVRGATEVPSSTAALNPSGGGSASTTTANETPAAARPAALLTLPPGSPLPSDLECAGRVVKTPEIRPANAVFNQSRGRQKNIPEKWLDRVTGDFSGTTEEILQWAACKWGINLDIVRAQAAKESYWNQANLGDYGTNPAECPPAHPLGVDGKPGQCPESFGIVQVRYQHHGPPAQRPTWPEAERSTAYNLDYTYAIWRGCYEGDLSWLNNFDRGKDYGAGDEWGCVGVWFSGRWYTPPANEYISAVRDYAKTRIWTTSSFINAR
jgi:hypothetical protein